MWRFLMPLTFGLVASGWAGRALSMEDAPPDVQPAIVAPHREPIVGVGYHPGNFIGPIAFDVIVLPLPHLIVDVQAGYWDSESHVQGLGLAPQLQWVVLRGWQTPYAGLGLRYEEVWSDGARTASKGGFLTGGWQCRLPSGFGVLLGAGVLVKTSIALTSPTARYSSSGGVYGTYEAGVRYFF